MTLFFFSTKLRAVLPLQSPHCCLVNYWVRCVSVSVCAGWTDRWWDCNQWPGVVSRQENKTNKLQHPSPTIYWEAVVSITLLSLTSTAQLCISQRKSFAQERQLTVLLRAFFKIKTWKLIGETLQSIRYLPASNAAWLPDCGEWQHSPRLNSKDRVEIWFGERIVIFHNLCLQGPPGGCFDDHLVVVWPKQIPTMMMSHSHWMKILHVGAFQDAQKHVLQPPCNTVIAVVVAALF